MFSILLYLPALLAVALPTQAQSIPSNLYSPTIASKIFSIANAHLPEPTSYPEYTDRTNGVWQFFSPNTWTSGFFPDTLYLLNARRSLCPGDTSLSAHDWLSLGRKWSDALVPLVPTNSLEHDVGFVSFPFCSEHALNPSNTTSINAIKGFSTDLAKRYSSIVGCTRSWDTSDPTNFEVIIDNMMNLDVFFQSNAITPNATLVNMAISHADKTIANHFRSDGSTYHVVTYNANTGAVISRTTSQGYADSSCWSRGQAWAIYGFANMYARTSLTRYLSQARTAATYFQNHLPSSGVPPWDFQAPANPAEADTSAGTIAANGMLLLSQMESSVGNETGASFWQGAAVQLLSDVTNLYWAKASWQSLLSNGTVNNRASPPNNLTGIVYGDYYYVKAGNTLLTMGLASCGTGTTTTSSSSSATLTSVPTGAVIHPGASATKCLTASSNANNAAVEIEDCDGSAGQSWTLVSGTLQTFGNKCLDVTSGSTTNGNKMQIYTCSSGNANQLFTTSDSTITWSGKGECLDLTGGSLTDGNVVQMWTCTGGPNQVWNIVNGSTPPPPPPTTTTSSTTSSMTRSTTTRTTSTTSTTSSTPPASTAHVIHPGASASICLSAASNVNNAAVEIETCNGSTSQQWTLVGGTLQIFGSKCLDVTSGSTTNGNKVQIYNCSAGNANQQFTTTGSAITWAGKGECLDLTDGSTAGGNVVQMWTCTGGKNQVWNIV